MKLERGSVYAFCYADTKIGTYSVEEDVVKMHVRFNPNAEVVQLIGTIEKQPDGGVILRLSWPRRGASLPFKPYTGDCSEVVLGP
jgi:hypothetical protein